MSWKRYAGGAAGATLGLIAGNVPGAIAGGIYGYKKGKDAENLSLMDSGYGSKRKSSGGYNAKRRKVGHVFIGGKDAGVLSRGAFLKRVGVSKRKNRPGKRQRAMNRKKTKFQIGPSVFAGKFSKPKKLKQTVEQRCLSKGYHTTVEQFGEVNDSDCVYLSHSSGTINEVARTIATSILRTLLTKAGFKITNQFLELSVIHAYEGANFVENSSGLRFVYTTKNIINGSYAGIGYNTVDGQSFNDIQFAFSGFSNRLIDYIRNTSNDEPYKIAVYRRDLDNISTNWILAAEMHLEDCHLELNILSSLQVQNRTRSALNVGNGYEQLTTDRIDSQPVKGMLYEFKNADPRVRHSGPLPTLLGTVDNNLFSYMNDYGLKLVRGEEYVGSTEPFVPKYWANITKATKVSLDPGQMKKTMFTYKIAGKIVNTLKKLRVTQWSGPDAAFSGMVGKCQMICFEETMRTPSANKIYISYEREVKIGAIVKASLRQGPLESKIVSTEINNTVA